MFDTMSEEFLKSEAWHDILDDLISCIECVHPSQKSVDNLYDDMISRIFQEMDEHIQYKVSSKKKTVKDSEITSLSGLMNFLKHGKKCQQRKNFIRNVNTLIRKIKLYIRHLFLKENYSTKFYALLKDPIIEKKQLK